MSLAFLSSVSTASSSQVVQVPILNIIKCLQALFRFGVFLAFFFIIMILPKLELCYRFCYLLSDYI